MVHEGEWHGTKVAVKKLVGQWLKNEDMVMRFREEINLMSTLHHPNVLMFIGAVMDPDAGNICLVTELCVHGDLYTFLHAPETKMTWKLRLIMATDIARGMLYLHRRAGIIQRDLKTANCLLDEHYHIKIADFGLSRRLAPGNMEVNSLLLDAWEGWRDSCTSTSHSSLPLFKRLIHPSLRSNKHILCWSTYHGW